VRSETAFVGLGSNLGDRAGNLLLAVRGIMDAGLHVIRLSSIYETEPVGAIAQPDFLNMVAEISGDTMPEPEQLMARLLRVEYALGRTRDVPKGPRTIDIDLLLFGNELRQTEFLVLPHPGMRERRFVLDPLAEIAPNLVHPVLRKSISQLLSEVTDATTVRRWMANEG
jgi:2-amino-4-hydroxy-6-hydroxymethyldihydropteridine diphosphokinase